MDLGEGLAKGASLPMFRASSVGRLALLLCLLGLATASAQTLEELDSLAWEDPTDPSLVRPAVQGWLSKASAAIQAEQWNLAFSHAERALQIGTEYETSLDLEQENPLARELSWVYMALARVHAGREEWEFAAENYRQAARVVPSAAPLVSAARIAMHLEDWQNAQLDLEAAINLEDAGPDAYLKLAEVLYQLGDTSRALEILEEGRRQGLDSQAADQLQQRFEREMAVESDYQEGGTSNFRVVFENTRENRGFRRRVEQGLERVYSKVCHLLDKYPTQKVPVVIYPSPSAYQAASGAPSWTAAVYNGKIRIPTGDLEQASEEDLERILSHEFSHYIVERLAGKRCPVWLQEGIAQHVEAGGEPPSWVPSYARRLLKAYGSKPFPFSVKQLEGSFQGLSDDLVRAAYCVSYYTVQALLDDRSMFRVQGLMKRLKDGDSPEEALEKEMYLTYAKLDAMWLQYARKQLGLF